MARFSWPRRRRDGDKSPVGLLGKSATQALARPSATPNIRNPSWHSKVAVTIQALRLKLLQALRTAPEEPKMALHRDRVKASIRCLVHLLPLGGALTLIALNFRWHFVGPDVPSGGLVALQFVAKLHELLIVASMTIAYLTYIRLALLSTGGLPFGAAFAGLQATRLSYLWSPEIWGSLSSKSFGGRFKVQFACGVFFITALAATVGPSSAACMISRVDLWPLARVVGGATSDGWDSPYLAIDLSEDQMYPIELSNSLYSDPSILPFPGQQVSACKAVSSSATKFTLPCPYPQQKTGDFSLFSLGLLLGNSRLTQSGIWYSVQRSFALPLKLNIKPDGPPSNGEPKNYGVLTSTQNQAIASLASHYSQNDYQDALATLAIKNTMDPYSAVTCLEDNAVDWDVTSPLPPLKFPTGSGGALVHDYLSPEEQQTIRSRGGDSEYSDLFFVSVPGSGPSALWVHDSLGSNDTKPVVFEPCTFELGWSPSQMNWAATTQGNISSEGPPSSSNSPGLRKATAGMDWLANVNPVLPELNSTVMTSLNTYMVRNDGQAAATAISALLAIGLSNVSPIPAGCGFAYSGPFVAGMEDQMACGPPDFGKDFVVKYPLRHTIPGYGYGPNNQTVQVALVVLFAYCIIALLHIIYSIWTGLSSSAWDSIADVVALAINSRSATQLHNTCAGIQSTEVFEHPVRIAAQEVSKLGTQPNDAGHLELVFPGNGEKLEEPEIDGFYGALKKKKSS